MVDTSTASIINDYIETHELLEVEEPTGDISSLWISQNEDLQVLVQPIPIIDFVAQSLTRNKEMEFRVNSLQNLNLMYILFVLDH